MRWMSSRAFQKYLMPGFVFQFVVIAGGYGKGVKRFGNESIDSWAHQFDRQGIWND
jgi:hypothetical protein